MTYSAPTVTDLGTMRDLTLQTFNKIGTTPDVVSPTVPTIVGSLVALP